MYLVKDGSTALAPNSQEPCTTAFVELELEKHYRGGAPGMEESWKI
jgi:hypothetical protein